MAKANHQYSDIMQAIEGVNAALTEVKQQTVNTLKTDMQPSAHIPQKEKDKSPNAPAGPYCSYCHTRHPYAQHIQGNNNMTRPRMPMNRYQPPRFYSPRGPSPFPPKQTFRSPMICYQCGVPGHIARKCTNFVPQRGNLNSKGTPNQ